MIPGDQGRAPLIQFLANEFEEFVDQEIYHTEEMAEAIASFFDIHQFREPYPTDLIALIGARCLAGLRLPDEGEIFLRRHIANEGRLPLYLEFLHIRPFSARTWILLNAGVLNFGTSPAASTDRVYLLDISLLPMDEGQLDLTIFTTIKTLISEFSGVWQQAAGRFHLVVKGLPKKAGRNKELPSARDVVAYCKDLLGMMGDENRWPAQPEISATDLGAL